MADSEHPVDDALRQLIGDFEPDDSDRRRAISRLQDAIASESQRRPKRHRFATLGWGFGVLLGAVGLLLLIQAVRPNATVAAMEEIAAVVEVSDPVTVPPQQYAYTKSEATSLRVVPREGLGGVAHDRDLLVYLLPVQREAWVGTENVVRVRTTAGRPIFFRPGDEAAYYAADLDTTDMVGETVTETMRLEPDPESWPEDKDQLDQAIMAGARGGRPVAVEYIDAALDLIRETLVSPEIRADTLRLISEQPGLTLEDSGFGRKTFVVDYSDAEVATRLRFTISAEGHLLEESEIILEQYPLLGIPAGTTIVSVSYSRPVLVPGLGTR